MTITQIKFEEASLLHQKCQLAKAATVCEEIIKSEPNHADAWHLLGVIAFQLGKLPRALELFNQAIRINPAKPIFYSNRGKVLQHLRQLQAALENYDYAIALKPDFALVHFNRGSALQAHRQLTEATQSYNRAIAIAPDFVEAYFNLANTLLELKQTQAAIDTYNKAIALKPDYADAYINCGFALQQLKQVEQAIENYDRAIDLYDKTHIVTSDSNKAKIHVNRGGALLELKQWEEAIKSYDRAITIKPDYVEAHYNKALVLLSTHNFEKGWELYEWRSKLGKTIYHPIKLANGWNGQKMAGSLLVLSEQGLGDEIFYSGMLNDLHGMVDNITIRIDQKLMPLYQRSFKQFEFISRKSPFSMQMYDAQIYMGSLGIYFRASKPAVHDNVKTPYLNACVQKTKNMRRCFAGDKKLICGLSWISKNVEFGSEKTLRLQDLTSILKLADIEFVDLQYGDTDEEQTAFFEETGIKLTRVTEVDKFHDVDGLAALIDACDVVLTISNTTAHLAGALGKKVIIMLPYARGLFWYWHDGSDRCPWYPTATLIRQRKEGDWGNVIEEVKQILEAAICNIDKTRGA